jgi:hypothetical protein
VTPVVERRGRSVLAVEVRRPGGRWRLVSVRVSYRAANRMRATILDAFEWRGGPVDGCRIVPARLIFTRSKVRT